WGITANGGSSNEHLIIEKANVTATGAEGSICDFQSITLTDCEIIQPEGAINNGHAVMLSGSVVKTEVKIKADNIIIHYDGDNDQGIGANGSAATFTVAIRLTNDELESYYNSHKITQVRYYIYGTEATSTTIKIYGDGTAIAPGELLVDELTSPPQEGWNTHTLSTPLLITSGDYWVGYEVVTTGGYPAGVDAGPAIAGKGDWIYLEGDWGEISNYGLNYNWNIRAILTPVPVNYGIEIAGTELTSDNAGAINNTNFPNLGLEEGGTITYDHSEKTFTLTGVTANVNSARFMQISDSAEEADYTINLVGNNDITSNFTSIALYRNLIVTGSGSLKVTSSGNCGFYVEESTLTIRKTTVEAKGNWGIAGNDGSSNEHLIIEKANVTATGAEGSICDFQSITLTNCEIIQPEGAINDGNSIVLGGSVVTSEVKISPTTGLSTLAAEGIYVWGERGEISIEIPGSASKRTAHIYNVSGMLVRTLPLQGTKEYVTVPAGIYIVRIGTAIEKVVVR
ncbi:MAG TPA: T9SS type A sorting domain-containing protein, partial [Paludibacteraceae bacterium]|nr:T9SS type A sorting domain-containing protein [Paludibacteraceae bacterium]